MAGNARYNLLGDSEAIRHCIETLAVVPVTDDGKAMIIVGRDPRAKCNDDGLELLSTRRSTHITPS